MTQTRTALITGGNGNLGRMVADKLRARNVRIVKFDVSGTEPTEPRENETLVAGDIRDIDLLTKLVHEHRPDTIYHLASLLSGSSELDLAKAWSINASASFELLSLAHKQGVEKFFFASTAATYGPVDATPMHNDYPQWPESMYGATKVAVERLGVYFKQKHGLDFRCLRFPLVISPFAPKSALAAFPSHALRAASNGEPFRFPVTKDTGISTIFLDDVIDSIVDYVDAPREALSQHIYNLHAYYMSAAMTAQAAVTRFPNFEFSFEPIDSVDHLIRSWPDVADDSDARRDWGWNPSYDFEQSIDRMCELLREESKGVD